MTINQLFNSLNSRLAEIENHLVKAEIWPMPDYYDKFRSIENSVDNFPIAESIPVIEYYLGRVQILISEIERKYPIESKEIKRPIPIKILNENSPKKTQAIPNDIYILEELEYYKYRIEFMLVIRRKFLTPSKSEIKKEILLPENFSLKQLQAHFTPALTAEQSALLLNYLREEKLIPDYKNVHLGMFGEFLFGKSKQDIRTAIGNVYSNSVKSHPNLSVLKNHFTNILRKIEKDLQEAI